jgi:hypothetical protein
MIGQAAGSMKTTKELEIGDTVSVDHQRFTVVALYRTGDWLVELEPQFGPTWPLEVGQEDLEEPIWEVA